MKPGVPSNNSYLGERADVVGAGLAGISAARVVFDYFSDAAGHNIKDIPWKKLFQPSTNSFVSPNEGASPNGRDCITYRSIMTQARLRDSRMPFGAASIENKKGFNRE
jgi:hypothetical protein